MRHLFGLPDNSSTQATNVVTPLLMDGSGTGAQNGTCKLSFYGTTAGGGAAPAAVTSAAVTAGDELVFTLGLGGNLGLTSAPAAGFQGYMFAVCNFQYGHGFAFVTNGSSISSGYLALVVPSSDRTTGGGETGLNQ